MDRILESPEVAALAAPVNLDQRVVYFPVRHFSPACAWHVSKLILDTKPEAVLIEGPRNATDLIPLLTGPNTRMPVSIYATFVRANGTGIPDRYSAYYPFCDFAPEMAAMRAARRVGARLRFIDLTFPEMVLASNAAAEDSRSLLKEHYYKRSRLLRAACGRAGARDPDDLWDHLFEVDFTSIETEDLVRNVLAYCRLARDDYTLETLELEGCGPRERAMAWEIAQETGKVVVVTGGFHTVALPTTAPEKPRPVTLAETDALLVLIRYSFDQLDRLNGYASGMPSPEFYHRLWESAGEGSCNHPELTRKLQGCGHEVHAEPGLPDMGSKTETRERSEAMSAPPSSGNGAGAPPGFITDIVVSLGRLLREERGDISVAEEIEAINHVCRLAQLRGHLIPSREDLLDGIRSVFIKGAEDIEGAFVLALTRKSLAGDRVGQIPPEAGRPSIITDFQQTAKALRLDSAFGAAKEVTLDLYRNRTHRAISRFLHQLGFLTVPFGVKMRGPDFVKRKDLDRIQEVWKYSWRPATEARLVEMSLFGATVEEASANLLLEQFQEAEKAGTGRSAEPAVQLLLHAARMGLHRHTQNILNRTATLVAQDASFVSLVWAMEGLITLGLSLEPLEAHDLKGVRELAVTAYERCCSRIPFLGATPEAEHKPVLDAMNTLRQCAATLKDSPEDECLHWTGLTTLFHDADGGSCVRGGAAGLLFAEGQLSADELIVSLEGHLFSTKADAVEFLIGLMATARSALWEGAAIVPALHRFVKSLDEDRFIRLLPPLRLAFSDLSPRETERVASLVAGAAGERSFRPASVKDFSELDMRRALEVNRRVTEILKKDKLEEFLV
jgi:hypothetical protein